MIKSKRAFGSLLICLLLLLKQDASLALPGAEHVEHDKKYIWGLTTENARHIHWDEIDVVPWRTNPSAGKGHRELWGHSDEWFYKGKLPKDKVMTSIKSAHPEYSNEQVLKEYQKWTSISGQERIAQRLIEFEPSLSKKEAMALAEQLHSSHILGDSTTPEGVNIEQKARAKSVLYTPGKHAISAYKKMMIREYTQNGADPSMFTKTRINYEILKAEELVSKYGCEAFNPGQRGYIGVSVNGEKYIVQRDASRLLTALNNNRSSKVMIPDDVYERIINDPKYSDVKDRIVRESAITGKRSTLAANEQQMEREVIAVVKTIKESEKSFAATVKRKMSELAPYAIGGAMASLSENWGFLSDAYDGNATWEKALTKTGIDFAGYTVTPYLVDGILTNVGGKVAVAASLKNAGMGYVIGHFLFGASKEIYSFANGDIDYDKFIENVRSRGKQAATQAVMAPVSMVILKVLGASIPGGGIIVPIVIIGGGMIIQRVEQWYQDRIWEDTVYVEDLEAFYGSAMLHEFTLLNPEDRITLLDNADRNDTMLEPAYRPTLLDPEERETLLSY